MPITSLEKVNVADLFGINEEEAMNSLGRYSEDAMKRLMTDCYPFEPGNLNEAMGEACDDVLAKLARFAAVGDEENTLLTLQHITVSYWVNWVVSYAADKRSKDFEAAAEERGYERFLARKEARAA